MNTIVEFSKSNWLEIAGVIFSVTYLYFSINRKLWLWVVGIISSAIYVIVFFRVSLYADVLQNVYYVIISIYGIIIWIKDKDNFNKTTYEVEVCNTPLQKIIPIIFAWLSIYVVVYCFTKFMPEILTISSASIPLIDSCLTSMAFVATWMLAKKYIEQWIIWMFVDSAYIVVYAYRELYLTCFLFLIYASMAVVGYVKWKQHLVVNNKDKI
jgi:nicotinamide mononucleotide transporter